MDKLAFRGKRISDKQILDKQISGNEIPGNETSDNDAWPVVPVVNDISPVRQSLDRAITAGVEAFLRFFAAHWLALINLINFGFVAGALLSPTLMAFDHPVLGSFVFGLYKYVCHQLPYRSDQIFGFQVAMCQRNMAIYESMLIGGIWFAFVRRRLRPLPLTWYVILITPMAIDGFTQLFGFRESNALLRVITGTLFGVSSVWLAYPYMEYGMRQLAASTREPAPEGEAT